jgi:hypothetical protein
MKDVARLLNDMLSAGIIADYAVFGAVAQMRYTPVVATIALSTGRPKDFARILALLESRAVSSADIAELAGRYRLQSEWKRFRKRFLDE